MSKWRDFIYGIGDKFIDEKRNIIIIDKVVITKDKRKYKKYKYLCNKCGYNDGYIIESNLIKGDGCSCCKQAKKTVVKGITDLNTTHNWMVKYFKNIEDTFNYSYGSNKNVMYKCPKCGFEKDTKVSDIYTFKGRCLICDDGFSYPNKVIYNLMYQLGAKFENEKKFEWSDNKRYDVYIEDVNAIVEMNGAFHYEDRFKNVVISQQNDIYKEQIAKDNGITNYIIIDARLSNIDFIKNNILNSKLALIYDLSHIDWEEIDRLSNKSILSEVCDYWNNKEEYENSKSICNKFGIERSTLRKYLNKGVELGICTYNPKEETSKASSKLGKELNSKSVSIYKNGILLKTYSSTKELSDNSVKDFGEFLNKNGVARCARGERKQYKGYVFKYIILEKEI